MRSEVCALPRIRFVRSPLGALLRGYVSDPAVLLLGRGPLGGRAYSLSPARGVVRIAPRPTFLFASSGTVGSLFPCLRAARAWLADPTPLGWSRVVCLRSIHASNTC